LKTYKRVELYDGIYKFSLLPNEHIIFTASYRPKQSAKHEMYFVVRYVFFLYEINEQKKIIVLRNNLTIIESILLRGEGGSGSLTVGNRKAGSSDIPLVLEMNEKQYKLCSSIEFKKKNLNFYLFFFCFLNRLSFFRWYSWKSNITKSSHTS
jgi:hypothetical protein